MGSSGRQLESGASPVGGDLTGTILNATVAKVNGVTMGGTAVDTAHATAQTVQPTADVTALTLKPGGAGTASPLLVQDTNGVNLIDANNASGSGPGCVKVNGALSVDGSALNGGTRLKDAAHTTLVDAGFTSSGQLGFWGNHIARPAAYTLTYPTNSRTLAADSITDPATTAATNVAPFGYTTAAQADAIRAAVIELHVELNNVRQVLRQLVADMQNYGLSQ